MLLEVLGASGIYPRKAQRAPIIKAVITSRAPTMAKIVSQESPLSSSSISLERGDGCLDATVDGVDRTGAFEAVDDCLLDCLLEMPEPDGLAVGFDAGPVPVG